MADQALLQEGIRPFRIPQLTFLQRYSPLSVYALPAESLDDTQFKDPETGKTIPSARQSCSKRGICYVQGIRYIANGNYWATVAASQDMVGAKEEIMLEEEHLAYALPCDERLSWCKPSQIRRRMFAQACKLAPLQPCAKSVQAADPLPAPLVDLRADQDRSRQLCAVEISERDLREAMPPGPPNVQSADVSPTEGSRSHAHIKPVDPSTFQQALLRTMLKTLRRQLAQTREQTRALELKARCALVAHLRCWQRRTRRRVVHVEECKWCVVRQCWVWHLMLKVPKSLLAEPAAQVAEFSSVILNKCQQFGLATFDGTAA